MRNETYSCSKEACSWQKRPIYVCECVHALNFYLRPLFPEPPPCSSFFALCRTPSLPRSPPPPPPSSSPPPPTPSSSSFSSSSPLPPQVDHQIPVVEGELLCVRESCVCERERVVYVCVCVCGVPPHPPFLPPPPSPSPFTSCGSPSQGAARVDWRTYALSVPLAISRCVCRDRWRNGGFFCQRALANLIMACAGE